MNELCAIAPPLAAVPALATNAASTLSHDPDGLMGVITPISR